MKAAAQLDRSLIKCHFHLVYFGFVPMFCMLQAAVATRQSWKQFCFLGVFLFFGGGVKIIYKVAIINEVVNHAV